MEDVNKQKFADFLSLNNIICNVAANSQQEVLEQLLDALKRHYPQLDVEEAGAEIEAREAMFSTIIAPGLAVPHARIAGLPYPLVAMACSPNGVISGKHEEPVYVTILLLSPQDEPNLHLQVLATLSGEFSQLEKLRKLAMLSTAQEVFDLLKNGDTANDMPSYLTAGDVMSIPPATLQETDTLGHAIRTFATTQCEELPVMDSTGDLRGVLSIRDLLHYSLPKHLLWMEDLSPIYQFQPFAEVLKTAEEEKIADVMREEFISVDSTVPAVQLAKLFLVNKTNQLLVTKEGKFAGMVELKSFCARLFWE
ncbi:MAG: PTS sugar transporter subunit IIA [Lentisphaeria bacterium]|nr:PTS sugar transporter subunit IIA [Lentisphaeria bacterium]